MIKKILISILFVTCLRADITIAQDTSDTINEMDNVINTATISGSGHAFGGFFDNQKDFRASNSIFNNYVFNSGTISGSKNTFYKDVDNYNVISGENHSFKGGLYNYGTFNVSKSELSYVYNLDNQAVFAGDELAVDFIYNGETSLINSKNSNFNEVQNEGRIRGDNNTFREVFFNEGSYEGTNSIFLNSIYNTKNFSGSGNVMQAEYINDSFAITGGSKNSFASVYNYGIFEGSQMSFIDFENEGEFNSKNSEVTNTFTNGYYGIINADNLRLNALDNSGLVYGEGLQVQDFHNFSSGWGWVDNTVIKGDMLNDTEAFFAGNGVKFQGHTINNSYMDVAEKSEFFSLENNSFLAASDTVFKSTVINTDNISGEKLSFAGRLENTGAKANITGEYLSFSNTYNEGMIVADNSSFSGTLENEASAWLIGSEISFSAPVINRGDIVGNRLVFNDLLENHRSVDSVDSEFKNISNHATFSAYTSSFSGKVEQGENAFLYGDASSFKADLEGGDYEIVYSDVVSEKINARKFVANNTLLNAKNMNFDSLEALSSSIYGGFRTKRLKASDSEFVLYFNGGYSGAIVVDEEISGTNNSIKIINYKPDGEFYPVLLAKSDKDLSKDFAMYATRGFSLFGFRGEYSKIEQNGATLLGIGDPAKIGVADINELFKSENQEKLSNKASAKIEAKKSELERVGVDTKIFSNLARNLYQDELLNNAILRLEYEVLHKDFFGFEVTAGKINGKNYTLSQLKANKLNLYSKNDANMGMFLYKLSAQNHRINGGGVYIDVDFHNFFLNFDFVYSEHKSSIDISPLGTLNKKYFHSKNKLEFGYNFERGLKFSPSIALLYEFVPSRSYENEALSIKYPRQNNLYAKLGLVSAYEKERWRTSLRANYYTGLSAKKSVELYDGFSDEKVDISSKNYLDLGIKTELFINKNLHFFIDISKSFFDKDLNSQALKLSFTYSF